MTVEQALSADNVAEERGKLVDAKQFLVAALADGTVAVKDLMQQVKRAGHVKRTIERAKQQLGVRSEQRTRPPKAALRR